MAVIDNLAPSKNERIKGTLQNQFDTEIVEKKVRGIKKFKKFKSLCLRADNDNYKEARDKVRKIFRTKKKITLKVN